MIRSTLKSTVPAALLGFALIGLVAAPVAAQSPLNDPAPGTLGTEQGIVLPKIKTQQDTVQPDAGAEQGAVLPEVETEQGFGETDIPATDIIRELAPYAGGNPGAPLSIQTPSGTIVTDSSRAIDLTVYFAYDSAQLLPEARAQLDALGYALNSPELLPYDFLIAGHTDAHGSANYNLDLSIRRAIAVADFLVYYHGIAPSRLVAHGWGEKQLRVPSDPGSGANRRVEVSLILPGQIGGLVPYHEHVLPAGASIDDGWRALDESWIWLPGNGYGLTDPRRRLTAYALDDFGATPTRTRRW
jgi:outer membrane protein OmpA-like peptidoglycan-associated protein